MVAVNAEGRVDLLNPAANALTGWSGEQARGRLVEEVVDLVDTVTDAPLPNPARTALSTGGPVTPPDDQATLKARNGDRFQVAVAATPLPGGDGAVLAIRDMTQSSRLRAAMRQERRILKLFVEHAPAAIAMFDREMRYLAVSRRFLTDHQLEGQDLIGQCHYDVFPDLPERWREANQRCLQGAVEGGSEDLWPRADGRTDWVRWAIHPWYEIGNQVGGLVLFSEVITARKEAELALEASRRQLAHLFTVSRSGHPRAAGRQPGADLGEPQRDRPARLHRGRGARTGLVGRAPARRRPPARPGRHGDTGRGGPGQP